MERMTQISRQQAASIIGCTAANIDNYLRQGLLTNMGEEGRYKRPRLLLSEVMKLRRPAKGRPFGIPNPRGGRKSKLTPEEFMADAQSWFDLLKIRRLMPDRQLRAEMKRLLKELKWYGCADTTEIEA